MTDDLWHLIIEARPPKQFVEEYCETVGGAEDLQTGEELNRVRVLDNGYAVLTSADGRMSLYETRHKHEYDRRMRTWATFARGFWSEKVPTEPGFWFARDRDAGRVSVRELRLVNGQLKDVSGGATTWGQVTPWKGFWWSEPVGLFPDSY